MQTRNPGVVFEYTVPKENATDTRPREFTWTYMDWTHCTSSCGSGILKFFAKYCRVVYITVIQMFIITTKFIFDLKGTQRAIVVCSEKEDGTVDDVYCNKTHKPDDLQRTCNAHLCPAR